MDGLQFGYNPDYSELAPTHQEVMDLKGQAILEFGAPWCPHCQSAERVVSPVLKELPNLPHIKLLDGKGKKLGRIFLVKLWPTFILLKEGKEISRVVRPTSVDEIKKLIEFKE